MLFYCRDKRHIELSQGHIKAYMQQILDGVEYIHSNWILHRVSTAPPNYNDADGAATSCT